jgi:hypothetical protein
MDTPAFDEPFESKGVWAAVRRFDLSDVPEKGAWTAGA